MTATLMLFCKKMWPHFSPSVVLGPISTGMNRESTEWKGRFLGLTSDDGDIEPDNLSFYLQVFLMYVKAWEALFAALFISLCRNFLFSASDRSKNFNVNNKLKPSSYQRKTSHWWATDDYLFEGWMANKWPGFEVNS